MVPSNPNSDPAACPSCGRAMRSGVVRGMCSGCLLRRAASPAGEGDSPTPLGSASREGNLEGKKWFGWYELLDEVARGGVGVVFRARDTRLGRQVALKVLVAGEWASPSFVERFRTEARVTAALDHPHIVPMYEFGEVDGRHYLAMRFLEGGSLADRLWLGKQPIPPVAAATLLMKIARAVHHGHQRGVLHRDLKPGNVLLDAAGEPYLADFGLARLLESDRAITQSAAVMGTPAYMAPEQAQGRSNEVTTAADVYGLGTILYELLSGQPLFAGGTSSEILRQVIETEPKRPSQIRPTVPRDLEVIALRALEKDPAARYGSAEAFADELERWLRGEPILARRVSSAERAWKWARRRPAFASLIALSLVSLMTVAVVTSVLSLRLQQARSKVTALAEEQRRQLVELHVENGLRSMANRDPFRALPYFLFALHLDKGHSEEESIHRLRIGTLLEMAPQLEREWPLRIHGSVFAIDRGNHRLFAAGSRSIRGWNVTNGEPVGVELQRATSVVCMVPGLGPESLMTLNASGAVQRWNLATGEPDGAAVVIPKAGRQMAACLAKGFVAVPAEGGLWLVPMTNGGAAIRIPMEGTGMDVGVDPSGRRAAVCLKEHRVLRFDLDQRRVEGEPIPFDGSLRFARFSPDGRRLAVVIGFWRAWIYDAETGSRLTPELRHREWIHAVAFSPDSRSFATASRDTTARIWDVETGQPVTPPLRHSGDVTAVEFSPDGKRLLTAGNFGEVLRWDAATGERMDAILPQDSRSLEAWFDSSNRVVTATAMGMVRVWAEPGMQGASHIWQHELAVNRAAFSPSGKVFVTAALDGAAHAFSMDTRQPAFGPLRHQGQVPHVEFSRDGARLLTCSGDKTVRLWDAKSGQALGEPLGHPDGLLEASLNASGTRIIARTYKYELFLWDVAAGRLIRRLEGRGFGPAHFNVDGTRIAALAPGNRVQLWESETGHSVALPLGVSGAVTALEFSADGQGVFLGYQGTNGLPAIQLRHWDSGVVMGPTLAVPALPTQVLPSPDGRQLAVLDGANTVRIWAWPSGILMGSGYQHPQSVYSMVFSADSRLVATACEDGAARVFDGRRGKLVAPPFPHGERAIHAVFSPDAAWLGTVSSDSTARLWRLAVNESSEQDLQRLSARLNGTAR